MATNAFTQILHDKELYSKINFNKIDKNDIKLFAKLLEKSSSDNIEKNVRYFLSHDKFEEQR